jgi:hypothetical protein
MRPFRREPSPAYRPAPPPRAVAWCAVRTRRSSAERSSGVSQAAAVDSPQGDAGSRWPSFLAAFSLATDLGLGQPMEHVYFVALLAWVGCVADTPEVARWFGDDIAFRGDGYQVEFSGLPALGLMLSHAGHGQPMFDRLRAATILVVTGGKGIRQGLASHCLTTSRMAEQLGLGPQVAEPLRRFLPAPGLARRCADDPVAHRAPRRGRARDEAEPAEPLHLPQPEAADGRLGLLQVGVMLPVGDLAAGAAHQRVGGDPVVADDVGRHAPTPVRPGGSTGWAGDARGTCKVDPLESLAPPYPHASAVAVAGACDHGAGSLLRGSHCAARQGGDLGDFRPCGQRHDPFSVDLECG